jgi:hypothetical protein
MRFTTARAIAAAAILSVSLAACQSTPQVQHDKHTNNTVTNSAVRPLKSGLLYNLNGAAGHSTARGYQVGIIYTSTGLGWMFFREAWSFGTQFDYRVVREELAGCGGGSCTMVEAGTIHVSEAQFRQAAKTGFEFKLIGRNGAIEATMPAAAFQEVLTLQGK